MYIRKSQYIRMIDSFRKNYKFGILIVQFLAGKNGLEFKIKYTRFDETSNFTVWRYGDHSDESHEFRIVNVPMPIYMYCTICFNCRAVADCTRSVKLFIFSKSAV